MKDYRFIALIVVVGLLALGAASISRIPQTHDVAGITGPDTTFDHLSWGGVATYRFSQSMTQNASTTCNWQTPAATSTVTIHARFSLASTSAATIEMGKSAGPMATTTSLGKFSLGAGAQGTLISSTTNAVTDTGVDSISVVAPSTWLAVKLGGGARGSVPTGTCNFSATTLP